MSCACRLAARVCVGRFKSYSPWFRYMDTYTRQAARAGSGAPPVLMLEARPTRVSCAALSLILVRTNWTGHSASRDKPGSRVLCAPFFFLFLHTGAKTRAPVRKGLSTHGK